MQTTNESHNRRLKGIVLAGVILLNLVSYWFLGRGQSSSLASLYQQYGFRVLAPLPIYFLLVLFSVGPLSFWWLRAKLTLTILLVFSISGLYADGGLDWSGFAISGLLVYLLGVLLAVYLDTEILPLIFASWNSYWKEDASPAASADFPGDQS